MKHEDTTGKAPASTSITGAGNSTTAPKSEYGASMRESEEMEDRTEEGADAAGRLGGPARNQITVPVQS